MSSSQTITRHRRIIVTGGAGFIGSNLVRLLIKSGHHVLNVDKLTYAGNLSSLSDLEADPNYQFAKVDISEADSVRSTILKFKPDAILHLAAESHVDRSIDRPSEFIETNVGGTFNLLQASLEYWRSLDRQAADHFRFLHVSTDEVYGSLGTSGYFTEETRYDPHSPYSASKAASDHLVRAWYDTYRLPVLVTNCSNNYGPFQFPEKLIPVVILRCLRGEPIPVYGQGENIRDWLYVEDHCEALRCVLQKGIPGQTYNVGGNNEMRNIDLVHMLCDILDELAPSTHPFEVGSGLQPLGRSSSLAPVLRGEGRGEGLNQSESTKYRQQSTSSSSLATRYSQLIEFVTDRPGHDLRYAIDASKIARDLGWKPKQNHESGFRQTVQWYLDNQSWWQNILSGEYKLERQGAVT